MLVLAGKVHHLRDFCFGHFIAEGTANADALLMNVEHYSCGFINIHLEKTFQHKNNKFHRGIVVVEQQYFVGIGFLGLGSRFGSDAEIGIIAVSGAVIVRSIIFIPSHICSHLLAPLVRFAALAKEGDGVNG